MESCDYILVTDRGGHLHNAQMLMEQMGLPPRAIVTTRGPDIEYLQSQIRTVRRVPYLFTWWGKTRFLNPLSLLWHGLMSLWHVWRLKPKAVVSVGATNVVMFCYWAWLFGARVYHVECMNQVTSRSITGRLLYPICRKLYVQWEGLLKEYGPKARYAGWVL